MVFCASISVASVSQAFTAVKQISNVFELAGSIDQSQAAYCFTLQPIRAALITGFPRALRPRSQTCAEEKNSEVENDFRLDFTLTGFAHLACT